MEQNSKNYFDSLPLDLQKLIFKKMYVNPEQPTAEELHMVHRFLRTSKKYFCGTYLKNETVFPLQKWCEPKIETEIYPYNTAFHYLLSKFDQYNLYRVWAFFQKVSDSHKKTEIIKNCTFELKPFYADVTYKYFGNSLIWSYYKKHNSLAEFLIKNGADVNAKGTCKDSGCTLQVAETKVEPTTFRAAAYTAPDNEENISGIISLIKNEEYELTFWDYKCINVTNIDILEALVERNNLTTNGINELLTLISWHYVNRFVSNQKNCIRRLIPQYISKAIELLEKLKKKAQEQDLKEKIQNAIDELQDKCQQKLKEELNKELNEKKKKKALKVFSMIGVSILAGFIGFWFWYKR